MSGERLLREALPGPWKRLAVEVATDCVVFLAAGVLSFLLTGALLYMFGAEFKPALLGGTLVMRDGRVVEVHSEAELEQARRTYGSELSTANVEMKPSRTWARMVVPCAIGTFLLTLLYLLCKTRASTIRWFRLDLDSVATGLMGGLVLLAAGLAYDACLKGLGVPEVDVAGMLRSSSAPGGLFLLAVIVAPVTEELYFRGRLHDMLSEHFTLITVIWITVASFAVLHFLPQYLPIYAAFGVTLSYLRIRTGGLVAPVIAHAVNNGLALFLFVR